MLFRAKHEVRASKEEGIPWNSFQGAHEVAQQVLYLFHICKPHWLLVAPTPQELIQELRRVGFRCLQGSSLQYPGVCKHAQTLPSTGSFGAHKPRLSISSTLLALKPSGS